MRPHLPLLLVAAIGAPTSAALAQDAETSAMIDYYTQAERKLPANGKQQLKELREEAKEKGWTFEVGATKVLTQPVTEVAATQFPDDILTIAEAQNVLARRAEGIADESAALAGVERPNFLDGCNPASPQFNWRSRGNVPKIRYQGSGGTCWSFAAVGAYEIAYSIWNKTAIDASEQHVVNCSKSGSSKKGGFYDRVFRWWLNNPVADEENIEYTGNDEACDPSLPGVYRAAAVGFVSANSVVPYTSQIKESMCRYGPLSVAMAATPAFIAYRSGIFNEDDTVTRPNHAVIIVGWDDSKSAWLVRNSWSEQWGEAGYAWMKYRTNKIGAGAAWIRPAEKAVPLQVTALQDETGKDAPLLNTSGYAPSSVPSNINRQPLDQKRAVWIQFSSRDHTRDIDRLRVDLRRSGFLAPSPENVGDRSPNSLEVRYFVERDKELGEKLISILKSNGFESPELKFMGTRDGRTPLEIWLPKG